MSAQRINIFNINKLKLKLKGNLQNQKSCHLGYISSRNWKPTLGTAHRGNRWLEIWPQAHTDYFKLAMKNLEKKNHNKKDWVYYISLVVLLFWWSFPSFNLTTQITCGFVYHVVKGKKTGAEVQRREGSGVRYCCPVSAWSQPPRIHADHKRPSLHERDILHLLLNGLFQVVCNTQVSLLKALFPSSFFFIF